MAPLHSRAGRSRNTQKRGHVETPYWPTGLRSVQRYFVSCFPSIHCAAAQNPVLREGEREYVGVPGAEVRAALEPFPPLNLLYTWKGARKTLTHSLAFRGGYERAFNNYPITNLRPVTVSGFLLAFLYLSFEFWSLFKPKDFDPLFVPISAYLVITYLIHVYMVAFRRKWMDRNFRWYGMLMMLSYIPVFFMWLYRSLLSGRESFQLRLLMAVSSVAAWPATTCLPYHKLLLGMNFTILMMAAFVVAWFFMYPDVTESDLLQNLMTLGYTAFVCSAVTLFMDLRERASFWSVQATGALELLYLNRFRVRPSMDSPGHGHTRSTPRTPPSPRRASAGGVPGGSRLLPPSQWPETLGASTVPEKTPQALSGVCEVVNPATGRPSTLMEVAVALGRAADGCDCPRDSKGPQVPQVPYKSQIGELCGCHGGSGGESWIRFEGELAAHGGPVSEPLQAAEVLPATKCPCRFSLKIRGINAGLEGARNHLKLAVEEEKSMALGHGWSRSSLPLEGEMGATAGSPNPMARPQSKGSVGSSIGESVGSMGSGVKRRALGVRTAFDGGRFPFNHRCPDAKGTFLGESFGGLRETVELGKAVWSASDPFQRTQREVLDTMDSTKRDLLHCRQGVFFPAETPHIDSFIPGLGVTRSLLGRGLWGYGAFQSMAARKSFELFLGEKPVFYALISHFSAGVGFVFMTIHDISISTEVSWILPCMLARVVGAIVTVGAIQLLSRKTKQVKNSRNSIVFCHLAVLNLLTVALSLWAPKFTDSENSIDTYGLVVARSFYHMALSDYTSLTEIIVNSLSMTLIWCVPHYIGGTLTPIQGMALMTSCCTSLLYGICKTFLDADVFMAETLCNHISGHWDSRLPGGVGSPSGGGEVSPPMRSADPTGVRALAAPISSPFPSGRPPRPSQSQRPRYLVPPRAMATGSNLGVHGAPLAASGVTSALSARERQQRHLQQLFSPEARNPHVWEAFQDAARQLGTAELGSPSTLGSLGAVNLPATHVSMAVAQSQHLSQSQYLSQPQYLSQSQYLSQPQHLSLPPLSSRGSPL